MLHPIGAPATAAKSGCVSKLLPFPRPVLGMQNFWGVILEPYGIWKCSFGGLRLQGDDVDANGGGRCVLIPWKVCLSQAQSVQSQVIFCLTGHTPDKQQMPQLPKGYHLFSLGNKALLHHWLLTGRCLTILGILKYSSLSPGFLSGRMELLPIHRRISVQLLMQIFRDYCWTVLFFTKHLWGSFWRTVRLNRQTDSRHF